MKIKLTETSLKNTCRDLLDVMGIFNKPILQGMGAAKGIPDRFAFINHKVVWIEFKTAKGKLSEHQLAFKEQCLKDKIAYWVIRDVAELEQKLFKEVKYP